MRVVAVRPDGFRLATLTGHLEAGQIEFRAREDGRVLEFTIESWARSGDRFSDLLYTHLRLAKEVQLHMWTSVLERVVSLAGGRMEGGVVITTRRVDDASGGGTSRRARRRLAALERKRVNFDAERIGEYARTPGWRIDDLVESLPHELPGPPQRDGTWALARRLTTEYQLAEPAVLRAIYARDAPLEGRDMLLRIRFLGLRFDVGVRVGEVYDEQRDVDGRRAHVFGWATARSRGTSSRARCTTRCGSGSTRATSSSGSTRSRRRPTPAPGSCEPGSGSSAVPTSSGSTARPAGASGG